MNISPQVHQVPGSSLLKSAFSGIDLGDAFEHTLEGLPNRDSLKYADTYNLKLNELNTLLRGTLRFVSPTLRSRQLN